jgi:hypothetical protein
MTTTTKKKRHTHNPLHKVHTLNNSFLISL